MWSVPVIAWQYLSELSFFMLLQYDPDLLNSFDSNPKRHLNYAARYSRSESLVDEEDSMLSHEAQPWNADLEGVQIHCSTL